MNSLPNDEPTIADVAAELRRYDEACAELCSLLRLQQRTRQEEQRCITSYTELKAQLKRDAVHGTIGGVKRGTSDAERFFFAYAVRPAAQALKPATNNTRVVSTWAQAVSNAQNEIRYKLRVLDPQRTCDCGVRAIGMRFAAADRHLGNQSCRSPGQSPLPFQLYHAVASILHWSVAEEYLASRIGEVFRLGIDPRVDADSRPVFDNLPPDELSGRHRMPRAMSRHPVCATTDAATAGYLPGQSQVGVVAECVRS